MIVERFLRVEMLELVGKKPLVYDILKGVNGNKIISKEQAELVEKAIRMSSESVKDVPLQAMTIACFINSCT